MPDIFSKPTSHKIIHNASNHQTNNKYVPFYSWINRINGLALPLQNNNNRARSGRLTKTLQATAAVGGKQI
jgi:hypothetical protein